MARPIRLQGGKLLTEELIERLSAEAERGYDLSKARRIYLHRGRPRSDQPGGESPRVAFRVPVEVHEAAKLRATREGLTLSAVVRGLLAGYAAGKPNVRGKARH